MITKRTIKKLLPKREQNSHKSSYGKVLNIAGSRNYTGAAYLSSIAALKVGAGYATLASSEYVCQTVASMTPDVTFLPLKNLDDLSEKICNYNAISIGCGLSPSEDAKKLTDFIITEAKNLSIPIVIDADGINHLSQSDIKELGQNFIITPHPKELSRLINIEVDEIQSDRKKYAMITAEKYNCTVLLKGHNSIIATDKKILINPTGCSALSKAGTGDVLTGMITGFLAQGAKPDDAAVIGAYLHGFTGDIYAKKSNEYSMLASDMLNLIPEILTKL